MKKQLWERDYYRRERQRALGRYQRDTVSLVAGTLAALVVAGMTVYLYMQRGGGL